MNSNKNRSNQPSDRSGDPDRAVAVMKAEAGTGAWQAAVGAQRSARAAHSDFYALAGQLVETVHALQDLAGVLAPQVGGYAASLPPGQRVYDDTRRFPPQHRLDVAADELQALAAHLGQAAVRANAFWSTIGHIGVGVCPDPDLDPTPDPASGLDDVPGEEPDVVAGRGVERGDDGSVAR